MRTARWRDVVRAVLLLSTTLFGLASIIATGGPSTPGSEGEIPASSGKITVSTETLAVAQGSVAVLRVDVEGLPEGDGVSGYAIDLSEEASRIDIQTGPCPSGVGTVSCREWNVAPGLDSVPGEYSMQISTIGSLVSVLTVDVNIFVIGAQPPDEPAMVATSRLAVTSDGRLWSTGSNDRGQAGVGFWNACDDVQNYRCLQPQSLIGYARVGSASDWTDAVSNESVSLAIRDNDSVWIWGDNHDNFFGFVSPSETEINPHQVAGLAKAKRVSMSREDNRAGPPVFLVMTEAGNVYSWGGNRYEGPIGGVDQVATGPRVVPQSVNSDCVETPLDNVVDIAGGTGNTGGYGSLALALKSDGTVWFWGREQYYVAESVTGLPAHIACRGLDQGLPEPVAGLPPPVISIAVGMRLTETRPSGAKIYDPFGLAVTIDGEVMSWDSPRLAEVERVPMPVRVTGLSDIRAVTADTDGNAAALANDGSVWRWRPGETTPERVTGAPVFGRLGAGTVDVAIGADCGGTVGSLWSLSPVARRPLFGATCGSVPSFRLTIARTGEGVVLANSLPLNCGTACSALVPADSIISLYTTPAPGWRLSPGGSCGDAPITDAPASLRIDRDTNCDVVFVAAPLPKTLAVSIQGGGRVVSAPAGIDCPSHCTETYSQANTTVTLTGVAGPGYQFSSFHGDPECSDGILDMSVSQQCEAVFAAIPTPAMPAGLTATASADTVHLDWTAVTDDRVVSYRLERADGSDAPRTIADGLAGRADSFVDVAVIAGRQYIYRLFAINVSGTSAPASVQVTTLLPPLPTPPASLRATPDADFVQLAWTPDTNVASYSLTRVTGNDAVPGLAVSFPGPAAGFLDSGLERDTSYTYYLVARNAAGSSAASQVVVTTLVGPNWTRVGATDIETEAQFGQPALALTRDGSGVSVALVASSGSFDLVRVFGDSVFSPNSWVPLGGSPSDSLATQNVGSQPSLAIDSQGRSVIAWVEGDGSGGSDIRAARFDAAANAWQILGSAPLDADLGNPALMNATLPSLAIDAADNPVVAWLQSGGVYVKRWDGTNWIAYDAGVNATGGLVNAVKLILDSAGAPCVIWRRGSSASTQLFVQRANGNAWQQLGGSLNSPLQPPRDSLAFFDLLFEGDGSPLAVWSQGIVPHDVLASRYDGTSWQPLPKIVDNEGSYAITGLSAARGALADSPPQVMAARQPVFAGANTNQGIGALWMLQNDVWQQRPVLLAPTPIFGLTMQVALQATPVVAWVGDVGTPGNSRFQVFVWRARF